MLLRKTERITRGLTLVEVVVVISVISLVASLLLVGIGQSRSTARRIHCQSNLLQIGVATHLYLANRPSLPKAVQGGSFLVHLLPLLEQEALFDQLRSTPNTIMRRTKFEAPSIYICPSDLERNSPATNIKAANYVGNAGTGELRNGLDGVFGDPYHAVRLAEITDGMSNTALMSECLASANTDNRRKIFYNITATEDFFDLQRQIRLHASLNVSAPISNVEGRGRPWVDGNLHYADYHHAMLPNESSGLNGQGVSNGLYSASSEHSSGVNLVRLDGSVVFLSNNIDEPVWWSHGSINGMEVHGD